MLLTNLQVKSAKPKEKQYTLADGKGLCLLVLPTGGKYWHFRSKVGGKEVRMSFGTYPEVSLADARERRDEARRQIASGISPADARKAQKAARTESDLNSFEVVAREWFQKFSPMWSASNAEKVQARLEKDLFPWIGQRPIAELKAPELLATLRRIEDRGAVDTAHRVKQNCGQIFRYAIATGRAERDVSSDLKDALGRTRKKHLAALTDPKDVGPLLRAIDDFKGSFVVRSALRLAPLVFVRPGELRQAEWSEFDLEKAEWSIPAHRMKMKESHLVPLSRQAIAILKELQPFSGNSKYLFPSIRTNIRPMSDNTINAALRRIGYTSDEMTGHGFRAMARTILDEVLGFRPDFIEHQLAHAVRDPNGRAYNRTAHLEERKRMMQQWADYLEGLKIGAKVLSFKQDTVYA
ncbi:MAG: integrase arm-type DNA-binding domain-containing protein [Geobacteraceae bacterium]|nr:integrase arm-type DNA-binding domain-containing protein [Geobacteraceae bacterium]